MFVYVRVIYVGSWARTLLGIEVRNPAISTGLDLQVVVGVVEVVVLRKDRTESKDLRKNKI